MEVNASRLAAEVAEAEAAGVVEVAEAEVEVAVDILDYLRMVPSIDSII